MTVRRRLPDRVEALSIAAGLLVAGTLLGAVVAIPAVVGLATGWDAAGTVVASGVGYAAVAVAYVRRSALRVRILAPERGLRRDVGVGLVVATLLLGVQWLGRAAVGDPGLAATSTYTGVVDASLPAFALLAVAGVGLVPVAEELLFRGAILVRLLSSFSTAGAVLLSSLLFAAIHVPAASTLGALQVGIGLLAVVVSGAVLAVLALRRDSLAAPIVAHAGYNAVSFGTIAVDATGGGFGA